MLFAFDIRRNLDLLCILFTVTRKNLTCWHTLVNKGTSGSFWWSESSWIRVDSGVIYLRSKSYLVVKTLRYSDRTLLSSMRSIYDVLPLRLPAVCMVSDCAIRKIEWDVVVWLHSVGFTPTGQYWKWYERYFLRLVFTFYLNRDTSVLELFPVVLFQ